MTWAIVIAALAAGGALVIYVAYPHVYTVKAAKEAGLWVPLGPLVVAYILAVLGPVGNFLHNVFIASFIFWDWPHELQTSGRIQRYVDQGEGWRYEKAVKWGRFMNFVDKRHIKRVPEEKR